jgi:hypothetical protein
MTRFGEVGRLLYDTVAKLGLNQDYCRFYADYDPKTSSGEVGIKVIPAPSSRSTPNHQLIVNLLKPPQKWCAWFGYSSEVGNGYDMQVWFYCGNRKAAESVRGKLGSSKFAAIECKRDKRARVELWNVVVRTKTHRKSSDRDWFASVFEAIGIEPVI